MILFENVFEAVPHKFQFITSFLFVNYIYFLSFFF
jgi:hypothetical protein